MEVTTKEITHGPCADCSKDTDRGIGDLRLCLECEMRDLGDQCARKTLRGQEGEALEAYMGRPATEQEAEAFMRHFLAAVERCAG